MPRREPAGLFVVPPAWRPAAGAAAALALVGAAHAFRPERGGALVIALAYAAGALVFARTGRGLRPAEQADAPSDDARFRPAPAAALLGLALVSSVATYVVVRRSLTDTETSELLGPLLWGLSIGAVLLAAVLAEPTRVARKRRSRPRPGWVAAALLAVFVAAAVARLGWLGDIPRGINADEGNRAARAISILTADTSRNLFESGWYYISNLYFCVLAITLDLLGVGYAQARVLGAVSSLLTLGVTTWIGFRHFGPRVGVLTAVLGATLGLSLQFARETTEATPTALLWAIGVALYLEAGRSGRLWAWAAAGGTGALSVYFYPTGRLWFAFAAALCASIALRAGRRQQSALVGIGMSAAAAATVAVPFLAYASVHRDEVTLRARQTNVFNRENAERLRYYDPDWNLLQLLWAQLRHAFAVFAEVPDATDFWPSGRPVLGTALTVLVLLGLGWFTVSIRSFPRFAVALWFWVGFVGVVVTVDTPNVQRLALAVPTIPLLAAGVLDDLAERLARIPPPAHLRARSSAVATAVVLVVASGIAARQAWSYFADYGDVDAWYVPTVQGEAVAAQPPGTVVLTVGRDSHQVNSGWVRLLAPDADRAGVRSPGAALPLPAPKQVAFVLYAREAAYLPYLRDVYPGGTLEDYRSDSGIPVVRVYRASAGERGAAQPGASAVWAPAYWNYRVAVQGGPARVEVDGRTIATAGGAEGTVVALARGRHVVRVTTPDGATAARVSWSPVALGEIAPQPVADDLPGAGGLAAEISRVGRPTLESRDGTVASCCLGDELGRQPSAVTWRGRLIVARDGTYGMALFTQGEATLELDGRTVIRSDDAADRTTRAQVALRAGEHDVRLEYRFAGTPGGIEWTWTPPGRPESIVPPSALRPPPGWGVAPPLAAGELAALADDVDVSFLETVR